MATTIVPRRKVSVPHLAKEWGVSTAKVMAFIKTGELPAMNIATSRENRPRYLIDRADIEAFERSRQVTPSAEPAKRTRRRTPAGVKEFF